MSDDPAVVPVPVPVPDHAVAELRRGVMHLARRLRAARGPGALSSSKLSLLSHLARRGPMTPGQLATAELLRPQSLTRLLSEMADEGLVIRRADPFDRRQYLLSITESGLAALGRDAASRDAWLARALTGLTPAERDLLTIAGQLMELLADRADRPDRLGERDGSGKPEPAVPVGG